MLAYGIPEFRLPKAIVQKEIDKLVAMGVNIVCDATIGKCMSIDELLGKDADKLLGDEKYEAVVGQAKADLNAAEAEARRAHRYYERMEKADERIGSI